MGGPHIPLSRPRTRSQLRCQEKGEHFRDIHPAKGRIQRLESPLAGKRRGPAYRDQYSGKVLRMASIPIDLRHTLAIDKRERHRLNTSSFRGNHIHNPGQIRGGRTGLDGRGQNGRLGFAAQKDYDSFQTQRGWKWWRFGFRGMRTHTGGSRKRGSGARRHRGAATQVDAWEGAEELNATSGYELSRSQSPKFFQRARNLALRAVNSQEGTSERWPRSQQGR